MFLVTLLLIFSVKFLDISKKYPLYKTICIYIKDNKNAYHCNFESFDDREKYVLIEYIDKVIEIPKNEIYKIIYKKDDNIEHKYEEYFEEKKNNISLKLSFCINR